MNEDYFQYATMYRKKKINKLVFYFLAIGLISLISGYAASLGYDAASVGFVVGTQGLILGLLIGEWYYE